MTTVTCRECGKAFTEPTISAAMTDRRVHMELRHLQAKIETDT